MIEIYFTVILFCLAASLINKVSGQNFLWIYFLLVAVYELGLFKGLISPQIYNSSPLAYLSFFTFYYAHQAQGYKKTIYILGSMALAVCLYIFYANGMASYCIEAGVAACIAYISFALLWFLAQLTHVDEISLLKKQTFWMSVSLLIWSVFFLFRLIPMYWLNSNDIGFLIQINTAYQVLTILCYVIFLKALACKF